MTLHVTSAGQKQNAHTEQLELGAVSFSHFSKPKLEVQKSKHTTAKALLLQNRVHQEHQLPNKKNSKTRRSPLLSSLMKTWKTWGSDSCLPRQYLNKAVPWVHDCCGSEGWKGPQVASTRSRASTQLTPGGSGPYPARPGKVQRMEMAAALGQPDPALSCPHTSACLKAFCHS